MSKTAFKAQRNANIVAAYKAGDVTMRELGRIHGISSQCVSSIIARERRAARETAKRKEIIENLKLNGIGVDAATVQVLNVSVRARNAFHGENIKTVGEIVRLGRPWLIRVPNIGRHTADEILREIEALERELMQQNEAA